MKRFKIVVAMSVALMVLFTASSQAATAVDWSESGFNPGHTGYNVLESTITLANALQLSFTAPTPAPVSSQVLVAGGLVLFVSQSWLYAIDADTGDPVWGPASACGAGTPGAPAIQSGHIWVGDSTGYLSEFSLTTGDPLGCRYLGSGIRGVTGSNGTVFTHTSAGDVVAVNASTGAVKWWKRAILPVTESPAVPALESSIVYTIAGKKIVALKASSGALVYSKSLGFAASGDPVASGGRVYFLNFDQLVAVKEATGHLSWTFAPLGPDGYAVAGNVVYVASEDPRFGLFAVDAATGRQIWRSNLEYELFAQPTVANGAIYMTAEDGEIHVIDPASGIVKTTFSPPSGYWFDGAIAVTVVNGTVYQPIVQTSYRGPGAVLAFR